MAIEWVIAYLLLGGAVGFFAGLLGVGGGGIMVPVLTALFLAQQFPAELSVHMALATSMAAIIVTSFSSMRSHQRHGAILWPVVWKLTPAILIGTVAAAYLAAALSSLALAIFFCCFMTYVAIQMLLNIKPKASRQLPGVVGFSGVGLVIGAVSALVAIGGGSLTVPFLTWCNVKIQQAIATSAAVGLPIAISGTLGYFLAGASTDDGITTIQSGLCLFARYAAYRFCQLLYCTAWSLAGPSFACSYFKESVCRIAYRVKRENVTQRLKQLSGCDTLGLILYPRNKR